MNAAWEDAIKRGDIRSVAELLEQGVNIDSRDHFGQTGLMRAAQAGHLPVVEALIAHRANLNVTAKYGLSALMLAIVGGHTEVARVIAQAGADLSLRGTGAPGFVDRTAFELAVERGMLELSAALNPNRALKNPRGGPSTGSGRTDGASK
jgi:ankyrin repeat protein